MSKNRQKSKRPAVNKRNVAPPKQDNKKPAATARLPTRRTALKSVIAVAVGGFGITSLYAYDKNQKTLHDLSVIGNGSPALVQIHDPSCPTCRRLKSAVSTAMKSTTDINYRLADITTSEGKALQNKYNVPHVTLLFFDGNGKHLHTTKGLLTPQEVKRDIDRYLSHL